MRVEVVMTETTDISYMKLTQEEIDQLIILLIAGEILEEIA